VINTTNDITRHRNPAILFMAFTVPGAGPPDAGFLGRCLLASAARVRAIN
jgi:hypothetical protein